MDNIKFPHITVRLTGINSNAYAIVGATEKAMRRGGCSPDEIKAYKDDAFSGDYDNLIQVTMKTVNCE